MEKKKGKTSQKRVGDKSGRVECRGEWKKRVS